MSVDLQQHELQDHCPSVASSFRSGLPGWRGPRLPQLTHGVHGHFRHKQTCKTTQICQGKQRAHCLTVWSGHHWWLNSGDLFVGSEGRACDDRVHTRGEEGRAGGRKARLLLRHPSNLAIYTRKHALA